MRLTRSPTARRLGNVRIHGLQRIVELDSGSSTSGSSSGYGNSRKDTVLVSTNDLRAVEKQMVIVVLCMNEDLPVLYGVLTGIPHDCLIILVSNSDRTAGSDKFLAESKVVDQFCKTSRRLAIWVHQRDPALAAAFRSAGIPELLDEDSSAGLVRNGKGEAMLMGTAIAALTGRKYIGFIDADNYVPGSVHEYCRAFAAGLHLAGPKCAYAMVRLRWQSKPKIDGGKLVFKPVGRCSQVVNAQLNRFLEERLEMEQKDDFSSSASFSSSSSTLVTELSASDIICTGNSGEHAMTMELALQLQLAGGFAIEPYELVNLFEQFACNLGQSSSASSSSFSSPSSPKLRSREHGIKMTKRPVEVLQIETLNPHFHVNKGEDHVQDMWAQGLSVLYHSLATPDSVREKVLQFMVDKGAVQTGELPARERVYTAVGHLNLQPLLNALSKGPQASTANDVYGTIGGAACGLMNKYGKALRQPSRSLWGSGGLVQLPAARSGISRLVACAEAPKLVA